MIMGLDYQQFWAVFVIVVALGIAFFSVLGCLAVWLLYELVKAIKGSEGKNCPNDDLYDELVR
jgi:hypothetical protein